MRLFGKIIICFLLPVLILAGESIKDKTKGMIKKQGYFTTFWDNETGSIFIAFLNPRHLEFLKNSCTAVP